ncbi:class I SAM-dependent methyltransferase [Maribacter algicola]|uniref:Class I SAM-dependent methyltransferase n=1 Tax=Meishania litoralis TaxID=3434685 RepID=A0ACC7LNX6_9FLAO
MSVLLKKPLFGHVTNKEIAEQLQSKKKCEKKLPIWFNKEKIYFPKPLSIEQTSSEVTARYKSEIVNGKSLCDLTGGFGVDSYFFSQKVDSVVHCELDPELSEIARHNFKVLGATNVQTISTDGLDYLEQSDEKWDWIYADPSRRNLTKGKVVNLEDYSPNIPSNLELLLRKSNKILLKTSPLLDLKIGNDQLGFVREIHIVAVKNEVKELLWVIEKDFRKEPLIKTINFQESKVQQFAFLQSTEKSSESKLSMPLAFLYEPNAAIMKSGAFKSLTSTYNIFKLHRHTHLYTADRLIEFPGRIFKIERFIPYSSKSIKSMKVKKANISVRNFPETVARLRAKYKIKDGGDTYLFFCKTANGKWSTLKCSKV